LKTSTDRAARRPPRAGRRGAVSPAPAPGRPHAATPSQSTFKRPAREDAPIKGGTYVPLTVSLRATSFSDRHTVYLST